MRKLGHALVAPLLSSAAAPAVAEKAFKMDLIVTDY